MIDAYQRGNRDGLLNAAAELDTAAAEASAEGKKWGEAAAKARGAGMVAKYEGFERVQVYRAVQHRNTAARLRVLAEALPEDPGAVSLPSPSVLVSPADLKRARG